MLPSGKHWTGMVRTRGGAGFRRTSLAGIASWLLLSLASSPAGATTSTEALPDYSGGAYQILAPGEEGAPAHCLEAVPFIECDNSYATDQGMLYNALTPLATVSSANLDEDYLSEKFGIKPSEVTRIENTEHPGLEILRDRYDIPHIFGETRSDVMFGSGYVAAEDRGTLLLEGLGPAFAAADGIPGINAFELLETGRSFTPSAQSISFVAEQKKTLEEKGPEGEQVITDLENWVEGVNAYEVKEMTGSPLKLPTVTLADAIAGFAFIGSIFGDGGGGEVANSNFLAHLEANLGPEAGLKTFRDLREVNDPEAPTTTSTPFPYDQVPTGPTPGAVVIDPGSASASAVKADAALKASRRKASNFLLVNAANSLSGHPLAVMGPQLGYFFPEIVMQADLHGGGIDAQGIIAPISPYVFIGRGRDFAWSLTSAGSENTQQFLEKLCEPDDSPPTRESHYYEYNGECVPMTEFDAGKLGAQGAEPARELKFWETVHGPVSGTVTVGGAPYAIANDRSTRGHEPEGELAFSRLDSDQVDSPEQFFEAADQLGTTFNMAYIDSKHTAFFSTGRLPILAPGTDPSLPTLGTGAYDWQGFLSLAQHPHAIDPASGFFTNWNNKPAPEWGAASDNYSYGPVHRVQLYTGFTSKMTEPSLATIMNRAATEDLRAVKVWPVIKAVLATGPAPSGLALKASHFINKWVKAGASLQGVEQPAAPGAAIMDGAWTPIAEAVLGPVLGSLLPEFESIAAPDNPPNSEGSSFDGGWYGYVYKDLNSLLGHTPAQPYSRQYCGNGSLAACRTSLWAAIQGAAEQLERTQGFHIKRWRAPKVRIEFLPGLLPFTMSWTNRSTFQQVIEFTGHAE
jgi:acyl-homoserine lactone acylase PvdQ